MPEFYEGRPPKPIEKLPSEVNQIATKATEEIKNIQLAEEKEHSTQAVTDLRVWLRDEFQDENSSDENIEKIINSLEETHFFMPDETISSVREKILDISKYLDDLLQNQIFLE